jgi:Glycosyltransferase family 87
MKTSVWRRIAAAGILIVSLCFALGMLVTFLDDKAATEKDFIEYWAAGQQLVHGGNPYDPVAVFKLERAVGLEDVQPKITLSPPVAFWIMVPLGFLTPKAGLILWMLMIIGTLLLSIWLIWAMNGKPDNGLQFGAILFPPAIASLMAGQLGTFMLLGIVLFLYFHDSQPFLAGMALLPCAWKPHLLLPFALVLLLWILRRKAYNILSGFLVTLVASCLLTSYFNIHVWSQYFTMMDSASVLHAFVPTLSVAMRFLVDRNAVWLQFAPEAGACVWSIWYFWMRRKRWNWMDEGLIVLLISVLCAPYAWLSDESVLLPAILTAVFRASERGRSVIPIAVVAGVALAELYAVGRMASHIYLWTTPAWLACYLYATWGESKKAGRVAQTEVAT